MKTYQVVSKATVYNISSTFDANNLNIAMSEFNRLSKIFNNHLHLGYVRLIDSYTGEILKEVLYTRDVQEYTSDVLNEKQE